MYFQNFMMVIYPRLLCSSPLFGEIYQACKTHITTLVEISVNTSISFAKLATSSPLALAPERKSLHPSNVMNWFSHMSSIWKFLQEIYRPIVKIQTSIWITSGCLVNIKCALFWFPRTFSFNFTLSKIYWHMPSFLFKWITHSWELVCLLGMIALKYRTVQASDNWILNLYSVSFSLKTPIHSSFKPSGRDGTSQCYGTLQVLQLCLSSFTK